LPFKVHNPHELIPPMAGFFYFVLQSDSIVPKFQKFTSSGVVSKALELFGTFGTPGTGSA